jgi:hypothetical protein
VLLSKTTAANAQAAGHGGSMSKGCNAGRHRFGQQHSDPKVHDTL